MDKKNGIDQRTAYGYNACGNRIAKEENGRRTIYAYNGKNQLVTEENAQVQENRYDAEGLRYEVRENANRIWFVYYQGELLYEKGGEESSYHLGGGIKAVWRSEKIIIIIRMNS